MADMDSAKLLEEIEIYIDNCKTAGVLSSGNMIKVNREELIAMLEEVRMRLPKEIAESKRIVKTKDRIIADARAKGHRIMQDAAKEAGVIDAAANLRELQKKRDDNALFDSFNMHN